jgi:hypothetical protein
VKYLSGTPFWPPTNIRPGWIGLPKTNTLAYYENPYITTLKSFTVRAPGPFLWLPRAF